VPCFDQCQYLERVKGKTSWFKGIGLKAFYSKNYKEKKRRGPEPERCAGGTCKCKVKVGFNQLRFTAT
jgi:hypothetical protein